MSRLPQRGVRIAGVGSAVPAGVLANQDFVTLKGLDTSDEWITQRTGIRERRVVDPDKEGTFTLSRDALRRALDDAGISAKELDLVIVASVTAEMTCPSCSCRVVDALGAVPAASFDLVAACCGFVYAVNVADSLIRSGRHRAIGVVGCDTLSTIVDYSDRSVSILFGDAAGAAVLVADDDPSLGCVFQTMHSDGGPWPSLYIPRRPQDVPDSDRDNPIRLGCLRMSGREIYRFAVSKLQDLIQESLRAAGLTPCDVRQYIIHQSNMRIIESAREKLGLPEEKVYINIDRYGNSSGGSVGLCFDELWKTGRIGRGDTIMMVAIGGGLTWASSVWKL